MLQFQIQFGLVLRRFVLRRFTFTTPVQSDRALPTCGVSLSQLKRPFCTQCASGSFPVCMCFLFCYFSAVLLIKLTVIFPPMTSIKKIEKKKKSKHLTLHSLLMSSEPQPGPSSAKQKVVWLKFCFNYLCNFLYTQFIKLKLYVIM